MADRLSRIIGTEEDKVNCPFYFKIGACRHGDRCSRNHLRPTFSQTVLLPHLYMAPTPDPTQPPVDPEEAFEDFYEEILEELMKFGEIEELHVLENLGDHMFGNAYVKFHTEEEAEACLKAMGGRYYAGRVINPEYSPVTDFREARCRQFDEASCNRGGYCNFMHMKHVPRALRRMLKDAQRKARKRRSRSRSRSRGRDRDRDRSRRSRRSSRSRSRGRSRRSSRSRSRGRDREDKKVDLGRSSSEERRAKIASWRNAAPAAAEDAAPAAAPAEAAPAAAEAAPASAE